MLYNQCIILWRSGVNENLINEFFSKFTYSSNKIENNETKLIDVDSIFKGLKMVNFKGDRKTITEIQNHKKLCKNIFKLIKENNSKLSIDLLKYIHYALMKDCFKEEFLIKGENPGTFKKGDYIVGLHDVGASSSEVEENLKSLVDEVNEVKINDNNALTIVSYFHCWFETIHPFADGNGRVGRILINYLLLGNNLPPIVLFENEKEKYYLALEHFNDSQEIDKMVNFLEEQAYKTWFSKKVRG